MPWTSAQQNTFFIRNNDATIKLNINYGLDMMVRDPNQIHSTIITINRAWKLIQNPMAACYSSECEWSEWNSLGSWREQICLQQSNLSFWKTSLCSDLGTSFSFHLMSLLTFTSIHCMLFTSLTVDNSMITYFWQYHSTVQVFCNKTCNVHIM